MTTHGSLGKCLLALALLATTGFAGGCGTAVSEAVGLFKGASGVYQETQPVASYPNHSTLAEYQNFELGTIRDNFSGKVPEGFMQYLEVNFPKALAGYKLPANSGGKTLVIEGEIVYFELRKNTLGYILGEVEEVVAVLRLKDKSTGKVLGTAMAVGRTTARVNFGVEKKAQGLARAMCEWVAAYYPKPPE